MRSAIQDEYGIDNIHVTEVEMPEPREGQVRLHVSAASINPADWHRAMGQPYFMRLTEGLRRPKQRRLGLDVCGIVDAVGPGVHQWQVGDTLFGIAPGAFGEFAIGKAASLAPVPAAMGDREAAALPIAGVTALQAVEKAEVGGKRVVVNGASGGVGHLAVQVAKAEGATQVVAVCSARNADWVTELGADVVVDYETEDFTDRMADVVIDCIGNRRPREIARGLTPDGRWILIGAPQKTGVLGPARPILGAKLSWLFGRRACVVFVAEETTERLTRLAELVDAGQLSVRIAGKRPLHDVVDAYDRIESQRTAGKILIVP